jgi:uncharacterized protein YjbI with pentapeptide repeats
MEPEELKAILAEHALWLPNKGGKRADLRAAQLSGANLHAAQLSCANLSAAQLSGADLSGADLRCANLSSANLRAADLSGANLRCADLRRANLSGADLHWADLSGANLHAAQLSGANLRAADLSRADLSEVRGVMVASCHWSAHGEHDRQLSAVLLHDGLRFYCGCFNGSEQELRSYIANGGAQYVASRTEALEFLLSRF